MDQYIGKMLDDRYEILELIGSGGMANVYKARCHRLNRLVAIKILKSDLADNADFRRRFHDESQAVAQLSHANIVSVYDVSTNPDREYIVMELIDGITLKQYMERRGRMDWRESLHFITQIMRGLSHAHSRGIIHRDIKPQNIMVLRDGSVKVADFGIACLANQGQTLTQEALGSVHYISPEQARGDRIDARSDIYSAGVVLYEMLTGRLPFEGDSAVSVAIQHLSSVPLAPRDIDPSIPEPLELICMKAMNSDPNKRYASADAMIEDLEKFRRDPSVDMDYIRQELTAPAADTEPTMPLPTAQGASAVKKHTGELRREREAEEEPPRRDKKSIAIIAGIFAAAVLLVVLLFKLILGDFGPAGSNKSYPVPDIRGKTVEEAQEMEGVKDIFLIEVQGTRTTEEYQPGQIVEQDPAAGRTRKSNLVIQVYVAAEPEKVPMKDLVGMEYRQARVLLTDMGLDLKITTETVSSDKYGADALRLTLMTGNAPGNDMRFYWERVEASRNFANKVWNASRFIMMNLEKAEVPSKMPKDKLTLADKWILSKVNTLATEVTDNMDRYELGIAVQKVYDFIWEEFCDWYIEMVKPRLYSETDETKGAALWTLKTVLGNALKLLHPFMPFITEEIYCTLNPEEDSIMIAAWPKETEDFAYAEDEAAVEMMKEAVRSIRGVRTSMNVPPSKKASVFVVTEDAAVQETFKNGAVFFGTLAGASEVHVQADKAGIADDAVSAVIPQATIYIPFAELVDLEKEIARLTKEEERLTKEIARSNGMLGNPNFINKAPEAKVQAEKEKLANYQQMMEQVQTRLEQLKK